LLDNIAKHLFACQEHSKIQMPKKLTSKHHTIFECTACGGQYPKWEGRCRQCGKWGTVSELRITNYELRKDATEKAPPAELIEFKAIDATRFPRIETGIGEFDRVLGGGIVPGSLVLIGGAPGIGKSTLLLQALAKIKPPILYFSGEESASQIKSRAERLSLGSLPIQFAQETNIERVAATIDKVAPTLTIIDSIQTMKSDEVGSPLGSINQISVSCAKLTEAAKRGNHSIFIIGHITKSGVVAGPKTLEHLVDTVLYLEGDSQHLFRILKTTKNRFGPISEVGIFEMREDGSYTKEEFKERKAEIDNEIAAKQISMNESRMVLCACEISTTSLGSKLSRTMREI